MDPLSIAGLVGALIPLCVKVTHTLHDVKTKYSQANLTISTIISECSVIATALTQMDEIAKRDPSGLSSRLDPNTSHLGASIELALGGCSITLAVLNEEVVKLTGIEKVGFLRRRSKAKYLWNEGGMKELLTTLRGQQSALHLLITAVQASVPAYPMAKSQL
jgi:hypothetical protein